MLAWTFENRKLPRDGSQVGAAGWRRSATWSSSLAGHIWPCNYLKTAVMGLQFFRIWGVCATLGCAGSHHRKPHNAFQSH